MVDRDDEAVSCTLAADWTVSELEGDVAATLGHPPGELALGRAFWQRLFADSARALALLGAALEGRQGRDTLAFRTGDGEVGWLYVRARPEGDGAQVTLLRLPPIATSEDEAGMGERLLRLVNGAPVAVFAVRPDGVCELSEGGALAVGGFRPGELVGLNWFHRFEGTAMATNLPRVLAGERFVSQAKVGGGIYVTRYFLERDAEGRPVRVMGFSIEESARVLAEERLAERTAELERALARETEARAMAEVAVKQRDEFLSVASHELRTPLAALHLAVQSLARIERAQGGAAPVLEAVATAERGSRRLVQLVDVLFDVSRLQMGIDLQPREVDLVALTRDMVAEAQRLTPAPIQVTAPAVVRGTWDAGRIEQLVRNLLANATKYGLGKPIQVCVSEDGTHVLLEVRDEGIGVPEDSRVRIFDLCERAVSSRHYGGLGLGLYLVRRIAEAHGGQCGVEEAPVQGSRFWVRLPKEAIRQGTTPA